jgi:hypothetical protein
MLFDLVLTIENNYFHSATNKTFRTLLDAWIDVNAKATTCIPSFVIHYSVLYNVTGTVYSSDSVNLFLSRFELHKLTL